MSQIFDALRMSEAERSGSDLSGLSDAPELLEFAERQVGVRQVVPGEGKDKRQTESIGIDQLSQFESVRVLVPPQSKLVCITDEESLAAEKFRFLKVRLRHIQQKRLLKRLLITSSVPEEGKSMIAANLAYTLAKKQQQKVLLLEGDLRRPSLARQLGLGKLPGLSELLQGEPSPAMNIYRLEDLGFWILPAGSLPTDPLELLQSQDLSALMNQLGTWFDWIVIDSPPVLPLGDTSVWMRLADGILMVTYPGKTAKRQLQRGLEAVEQSKVLGALINGSTDAGTADYYHYYGQAPASQASGRPA
jgi:capsular exopolysaccharide synthesis family protein